MNFKLEFNIPPLSDPINLNDSIMLMGSCFAEHIYDQFITYKLDAISNPNGILFNPLSIYNALQSYCEMGTNYDELVLEHEGLWHSWWHHGSFCGSTKDALLKQINDTHLLAHQKLKQSKWLIVTWGSAFVYEHTASNILVANCHKVPAGQFTKRMLSVDEILNKYNALFETLKNFNPQLNIIMSISPVRYIRDGLHENSINKATLHLALKQLMDQHKHLFYFPAYEIVNDELRDYRFFENDLVHPNKLALDYVWERFTTTCFDHQTKEFLTLLEPILQALKHRPIHAGSSAHKLFRAVSLQKTKMLQKNYPSINLQHEIDFFENH